MKNLRFSFTFCLGLFSILLISQSCGEQSLADSQNTISGFDTLEEDSVNIHRDSIAISVWEGAGLRREPGRHPQTKDDQKNFITGITYGEAVQMLGITDTVVKEDKRVYMKVRLQDGKEGWTDEYLFEKNARRGVVVIESDIYRRPDVMTLRPIKMQAGEIVVTMEEKDGWLHVSGPEKRKKGWIKLDQGQPISYLKRDIQLANMFDQAQNVRKLDEKIDALKELTEDDQYRGSILMAMVQHLLNEELINLQSTEK